MKNITDEKSLIIDKILKLHFNSNIIKACSLFNAESMASYLENKLEKNNMIKYEKHLHNCNYCLKIFHNIKNVIKLLNNVKFNNVHKELLEKALNIIDNISQEESKKNEKSSIWIKLIDKGIELIEAINLNNLKPIPVPNLRSSNKKKILKEIKIECDFKNHPLKITLTFLTNNSCNIKIEISDNLFEVLKGKRLLIKNNKTSIDTAIIKVINISNIEKGKYSLILDNIKSMEIKVE